MNERLCYWLTASAAVWLMGRSGDYKDAIRVYSRIIWPLFALLPFSPAPCGYMEGAVGGAMKILGS